MPETAIAPPKHARAIPGTVRAGIDSVVAQHALTWVEAAFVVARKMGLNQREAYLFARPGVTPETATANGWRMERRVEAALAEYSVSDAMAALADVVAIQVATSQVAAKDRLTATDQINKVLGRYKDAGVTVNVLASLGASPQASPMPSDAARPALTLDIETCEQTADPPSDNP